MSTDKSIIRAEFETAWEAFAKLGWTGAHNKLEAWQWWHVSWRACEEKLDSAGESRIVPATSPD